MNRSQFQLLFQMLFLDLQRSWFTLLYGVLGIGTGLMLLLVCADVAFGIHRMVKAAEAKPIGYLFLSSSKKEEAEQLHQQFQVQYPSLHTTLLSPQEALKTMEDLLNKHVEYPNDLESLMGFVLLVGAGQEQIALVDRALKQMEHHPQVEQVVLPDQELKDTRRWLGLFQLLSGMLGILVAFVICVLVVHHVQLLLSKRKEEMRILEWLGARQSVLLFPLLFQGFLTGLVGALVGCAGFFFWKNTYFFQSFENEIWLIPLFYGVMGGVSLLGVVSAYVAFLFARPKES